jgi:hypothetical protein
MRYKPKIWAISVYIINILFISCIDENITNISESVEINSSYSLPIGDVLYSINDYFELLDSLGLDTLQLDTLQLDSLRALYPGYVGYEDTVYVNIKYAVDTLLRKQFDFSSLGNDLDKIKAITFVLIIDNEFPTETHAQVYLADESMTFIDSIFSGGPLVILRPDLDNNGIPIDKSPDIRYYPVSESIIENLAIINNIMIYGYVETLRSDVDISKFYSDYELYIHIGVRVELEYNTADL